MKVFRFLSKLTFYDHSRDFADYLYVYPVLSRRSQGVSLGINLNTNNSCNWRCVYCQVENLVRGEPEPIDLMVLERELDKFLDCIFNEDFLVKYAPAELRRLNDICISGNGESTLSEYFLDVIKIIVKLKSKYDITNSVKLVLITNGSQVRKANVIDGISLLNLNNGEVWFKIDRIGKEEIRKINQVSISPENIERRLELCSSLCSTYIQTCFFKVNGLDPSENEVSKYVDFIVRVKDLIAGVLLYSTARKPMLAEGIHISQSEFSFLKKIADMLICSGVNVKYYQ